jgi:aquaporin related protein
MADADVPPVPNYGHKTPEMRKRRKLTLLRACLAEMLGSALLIYMFFGCIINLKLAGGLNPLSFAMAHGFFACGIIFAVSDISGAHLNPAVTFATWITRKTSNRKAMIYMLSQVVGSLIGCLLILGCFPDPFTHLKEITTQPPKHVSIGLAYFSEVTLSFILVFVIFNTAFDTVTTSSIAGTAEQNLTIYKASPNSKAGLAPLAIGVTYGALTLAGTSIGGAIFNPLRVFAPAVFGGSWEWQWIYWLGDFTGAALAGIVQVTFARTKVSDHKEG